MYGKLFAQMYDGTLASNGPWQALVTFQQLIILADKHGNVDMTPQAIARRTTIPIDVIELGIKELEKCDPSSRTPDEEGRRIVRLNADRSWGWRIVNHGHYRAIRSEEERREYHKLYQRKRRAKTAGSRHVNTSTRRQQNQPIAVSRKQDVVSNKQELQLPRLNYLARLIKAMNETLTHCIGPDYKPVREDQFASVEAAARLEKAGIPIKFAERHLQDACRKFNPSKHGAGKDPCSLKYFAQGIFDAWRIEPKRIGDFLESQEPTS